MNTSDRNTADATTIQADLSASRITLPTLTAWLLFSAITLIIGIMALPKAGRYYDFRAFYSAGYLVLHHPSQLFDLSAQRFVQDTLVAPINPPLPYYHPAFEAFFYAPLALFTYRNAYILYAVFNLLLLGVCFLIAPRSANSENVWRALLFLLPFQVFYCVATGQDSIVFLLLLCLLWKALARNEDVIAGAVLALCLFKIQLVAAIVIFLVARRGTRLLRSFLPTAAALTIVSVLITGIKGAAQWINLLTSAVGALNQGRHAQDLIAVHPKAMPTLNGLIYFLGGRFLPPNALWLLNLMLLAATFIATLLVVRRSSRLSDAYSAAIAGALLLSPHLYLYDYILLIPPLLLLRNRFQHLLIALFCILPFILYAIHGLDWLSPMAVLPIAMLALLFVDMRSQAATQTQPENVTDRPLTAFD